MMRPTQRAFTLVEVMVVVLLAGLLLVPIFQTLRTGMHNNLRGMLQVATTLQARRILHQAQVDLQQACLCLNGKDLAVDPDALVRTSGTAPEKTWTFNAFPTHGGIDETFTNEPGGVVWRNVSEVSYALTQNSNGLLTLSRLERFHPSHPLAASFQGGVRVQTLSEKVNYFSIDPMPVSLPARSALTYRVHLQLVDSLEKRDPAPVGSTRAPAQRQSRTVIADFFIVVNPHFYNRLLNRSWYNPNWQTAIRAPRE